MLVALKILEVVGAFAFGIVGVISIVGFGLWVICGVVDFLLTYSLKGFIAPDRDDY